jgi:hypothetical protein
MKKLFLTVAGLALLSSGKAWALAGGPFDNGDPGGLLMERGGFYQCQFSFSNGNGYGIFTPDSLLAGNLPGAQQGGGSSSQQIGVFNRGTLYTANSTGSSYTHNANRSVFYYKGVTYVGSCFGFVDADARQMQGAANASSNETITQQTLSQNTGGLINASQAAQTNQQVVVNTAGFILNVGWTGKIIKTRPNLRFRGKGELTVVSPSGESTLSSLAFSSYTQLIDGIVQAVGSTSGAFNPLVFTQAQTAIDDILTSLGDKYLAAGGADALYKDANKHPVRVTGNRRFF